MITLLESSPFPDSLVISIGLLLQPDQAAAAIELSQSLGDEKTCSFLLDKDKNPPRVRLYETVFPNDQKDSVMQKVEKLASEMIKFPMPWGQVESTTHFVAIWGQSTEPLSLFHDAILEAISPLRHGYYKQKYVTPQTELSEQESMSLQRWGSVWAEPYAPHMLIAKAMTTFAHPNLSIEWGFQRCQFQGLLVEVKRDKRIEELQMFPFGQSATI